MNKEEIKSAIKEMLANGELAISVDIQHTGSFCSYKNIVTTIKIDDIEVYRSSNSID